MIDVLNANVPYVNENLNCEKYAILTDGDIVIADTAEDDTVGKTVEIINKNGKKTISGLHTICLLYTSIIWQLLSDTILIRF